MRLAACCDVDVEHRLLKGYWTILYPAGFRVAFLVDHQSLAVPGKLLNLNKKLSQYVTVARKPVTVVSLCALVGCYLNFY